jgi:hypothetical protein
LAARAKYAPNFSLLTAMGQVTAGAIRNPAAASAGVPWRRRRHFDVLRHRIAAFLDRERWPSR